MGRGLISGAIWGAVISGAALSVASLLGTQPAGNRPPAAPQVEAPAGAEAGAADPAAAPARPVAEAPAETAPVVPEAPTVSTPGLPDGGAPMTDTSPAAPPQTGGVETTLGAPAPAPETGAAVGAEADDPVLPAPQSVAPQMPANEDDVSISTDPAQPPAPEPDAQSGFDAAPEAEEAETVEVPPETPDEPAAAPEPVTEDAAEALPDPAPEPEPDATTEAPEPATPDTPAEDTPDEPAAESGDTATAEAPASTLPQGDSSITIRRPEPATPAPAPEAAEEIEVEPVPEDAPALLRFAAGFEDPEGRPLLSVVLIDDGTVDEPVPALLGLPFPVSIAIDPAAPGAREVAALYRNAGFEVLALANLPEGAQPSDAEVALEAAFQAMPEAIGMVDAGASDLGSGTVTEQVMAALAAEGRGFVTVPRGLSPALRVAEQAEVPAATIYRDLDAEGQDARVIRRFLDQAAFRARQESGVVMLGRVRPDTISALILWGTANRAGQVALVPVSAVLRGEAGPGD